MIALWKREEDRYSDDDLAEYNCQFTIRYEGETTEPVEWQKFFEMDLDILPDYFCYGWLKRGTKRINDYAILDVPAFAVYEKLLI